MSHGTAGAEESPHERALVPLLDMVFQLIMFFIISVNFAAEQVNESIKLPKSQMARPMDKSEVDVLFVNIRPYREEGDGQGKFKPNEPIALITGREPMRLSEAKVWLAREHKDAELKANGKRVNTAVIIRADQSVDYADIFWFMQACKDTGFSKIKVRAMTESVARGVD